MSILQMSIIAGALVTAVVLIRAVALNRLPKKMFLVLWGVVLVRLLVPVAIPINIDIGNNAIGSIAEWVLPNSSAYLLVGNVTPNPAMDFSGIPGIATEQTAETPQGAVFWIAPTIIWLVGMVAAFIFFAVIFIKNHRTLRFATLIKDNDFLYKWLAEHRHIRPIAIMQSDRITSPFAIGVIKPRIILPKSMDMNDRQLLDYVLAHEYFHIKRFDAFWKMLLLLAVCVHWFNPFVWVMFVLANRDLELTCDEAVIRRFGATTKKAYAYMLISMAKQKGKFAPLYSGFSKNAVQERIVSIMKVKKSSVISVALAVVLVAMLGFGALTSVFAVNTNPTDVDNVQTGRAPGPITSISAFLDAQGAMDALGGEMRTLGDEIRTLGDEMRTLGDEIQVFADSHPISQQEARAIALDFAGLCSSKSWSQSFDVLDERMVWRLAFWGRNVSHVIAVDAITGEATRIN